MIYEQESGCGQHVVASLCPHTIWSFACAGVSKFNKMDPLNGMDFAWDNEIGKAIVEWLDPPSSSAVYGPHLPRSSSDSELTCIQTQLFISDLHVTNI